MTAGQPGTGTRAIGMQRSAPVKLVDSGHSGSLSFSDPDDTCIAVTGHDHGKLRATLPLQDGRSGTGVPRSMPRMADDS
jgi:hypothetical protein